jgi:CrcB protein
MKDFLWISVGAVAGANLRYAVSHWAARTLSASLPWGTLIVNITGSFILGFFLVWITERVLADPRWRILIAVGFCSAYTTFSSYAFETLALWQQGHRMLALGNLAANNLLALLAVFAGALLARML